MAVSARVRHAAAVLLLAASGVLAACTSNPTPAPLPSLSPSQSGGPSATDPTPPVLPAAAHGTGPKAAKAFVRYWVATLNYAGATGDTSQLRSISSPKCASCSNFIRGIRSAYTHGGSFTGGDWRITASAVFPSGPKGGYAVAVTIKVDAQVGSTSSAAPSTTSGPSTNTAQFYVARRMGWTMLGFEGKKQA